jgi:Lipocalin-like domain
MFKAAAIAVGFVLVTQAAVADDAAKVVGIWKLVSFEVEFQDGSPRRPAYGARPTGYIIFTAQGRMMTVIEGEGRKVAGTDEERAALLRTMFAYTGTYRLEDDKWVTKVDVSWNPAWNGTDQVRFYKIDGDRLQVTSAYSTSANLPGSPVTRGVLMWERVK